MRVVDVSIRDDDDLIALANSRQSVVKVEKIAVDTWAVAVGGDDDGQGWRAASGGCSHHANVTSQAIAVGMP